jgi:DNA polymerase III delta prime subunit
VPCITTYKEYVFKNQQKPMENNDKSEYIQDRHLDKMLRPDNMGRVHWPRHHQSKRANSPSGSCKNVITPQNIYLFYGPPGLGKTTTRPS